MKRSVVIVGLILVGGVAAAESVPRPFDLGTLGGDFSSAADMNEHDQVVGSSFTSGDVLHAFRWERGRFEDLGTLGGPTSRATAINEPGDVVGASTPSAGSLDEVAFLWRGQGRLVSLGTLPGDHASQANDIDDHGEIAGQSGGDTPRAVVWKGGHIEAL